MHFGWQTALEMMPGHTEAGRQSCCAGLCRRCSLGYLALLLCLQGERTPLLTLSSSSCTHSQLQKKTFRLLAWTEANPEAVTKDSMHWAPRVVCKPDLVLPWSHAAVEKPHCKGRTKLTHCPQLLFYFILLLTDSLLGQVEVSNSLCLQCAHFHIFIFKHKSVKSLYQIKAKFERLLE